MKKLNQNGAVSIISVVIFILIITIVVTAYLGSALSQQRTSVNLDMGTRAYYAAESGVQDAARGLNADISLTQNTCKSSTGSFIGGNGVVGASDQYGLSYTCQIIDPSPTEITGSVDSSTTAMIRITPEGTPSTPNAILLKWSLKTKPSEPVLYPRNDNTQSLKKLSDWQDAAGNKWHPMLRVALLSHPLTGSFNRNQIGQNVVFLNPKAGNFASPNSVTAFSKGQNPYDATVKENMINDATCVLSNAATDYSCEQLITLTDGGYSFSQDQLYVRIGSLYGATNFSMQVLEDDQPFPLKNVQATIDVTGRAKDVYRRVKQAFPLSGYVEDTNTDAAVVAGEGICKQFSVTNNPSEFDSKCNPNP